MLRRRLSIAGIVTTGLVASATFLLGALAVLGYRSYRARLWEQFHREHIVLTNQLATSLALPLWNFDRSVVDQVIEGAMSDEDVFGIAVQATGDEPASFARIRDENGKVTSTTGKISGTGLLVETHTIMVGGEVIGHLQVFTRPSLLEARLRRTLVSIVGVIGLLDLLLVAGIYLLLWRTVLRPLREVEQHALAVTSGIRSGAPPPGRYLGELESLRSSIEKMIGMLEARYAEARESEAQSRALAETLRESEEKFSTAFRASPDAIVISDLETGRILEANDSFLQIYKYLRAEAIGRTTLDLDIYADPGDRERLTASLRASGSVRGFKIRGQTRRGEAITVLLSSELINFGGARRILTIVHDFTAQERAEAALRESEEKFSKAFRSGPDAMSIAEMDTGRYVEVNDGFERIFGYTRAEVLGRTSIELGIWRDAASRAHFIDQLQSQGAVRDFEYTTVNRHGKSISYLLSAEGIKLGGNDCIVSVIHDITDRKNAEDEYARAVERERRARDEFTKRLIASQEAERRRIAGELHDSLGQNLLLIKNRAQLALSGPDIPPHLGDEFESIQVMATQAISEVRQISHDLRPYQLDQLGLTRALEALIDSAGRNTGFPFTRKLEAVDDLFAADAATNLYRIVQEGLANILNHARAKKAAITLERDVRDVRLCIEDDGCGFVPGAAAPQRKEGGFGLRGIAERARILSAELRIESAPGRGTRIELTIPMPEDVDS